MHEDQRLHNGIHVNKDWPTDEPYMFDSVVMNLHTLQSGLQILHLWMMHVLIVMES